ncbi:MAG: response regulator transcription factor [Holophaga sp.]|nr:response regulator transcription factor [Holophaga sp.]
MAPQIPILIVEDEPAQRLLLAAYLRQGEFQVLEAASLAEAWSQLKATPPQLVLLDLNLPDGDGLELADELRRREVPVVILTCRAEDRVRALERGADDFLDKPFNPRELVARMHNLLRRYGQRNAGAALTVGSYCLDLERRQLCHSSGAPLNLTRGEFNLLAELAEAEGRALCRAELAEAVSPEGEAASLRSVDVLISRLRQKMEEDPRNPRLLVTVPGYGYRLEP